MESFGSYEHITAVDWNLVVGFGILFCTILGAQWRVFTGIQSLVKEVVAKLEYHERHDDQRFSSIEKMLGDMRLSVAVQNAVANLDHGRKENRRIIRRTARA